MRYQISFSIQLLIEKLFVLALTFNLLLFSFNSFSQNAGIGINAKGSPPNSKALLDVDATGMSPKAGILIPRINTNERNAISAPIPESLMIYNTDTHCFEAYFNEVWVAFSCLGTCTIPSAAVAGTNTPSQNQIVWNWSTVSGATGYQWNTSSTYPGAGVNIVSSATFTQTGLICNTPYSLYIWAINTCGHSTSINLTQKTSACSYICPGNGSFVDARDGKTYGYVNIGVQTWMCQNLDYGSSVSLPTGQTGLGTQKYCYGNDTTNCDIYGGLYEWAEMMNGSPSCNGTGAGQPACSSPIQGICPAGWHVPSHYEWTLLENVVGSNTGVFPYDMTTNIWLGTTEGDHLKATTGWKTNSGDNSSRFSAIPGGDAFNGNFYLGGSNQISGGWWTSTEGSSTTAWYHALTYSYDQVYRYSDTKTGGWSVRCLKN